MQKQLEYQVKSLKSQNAELELSFHKKKQQYEQIIHQLQTDNDILRKQVLMLSPGGDASPLSSSPGESPKTVQSPVALAATEERPIVNQFEPGVLAKKMADIEQENAELKRELGQMTQIYQEQILQLTNYFNLIKQSYFTGGTGQPEFKVPELPHAQIVSIYDKIMQDFTGERKKYVDKIQELLAHIEVLERKTGEKDKNQRKLQLELDIAQEELKIHKRRK